MIDITIIIPTYNAEQTIGRCILSTLNQSYKNFEILIVDGLSVDNTVDIVNSFIELDERVKLKSENDNGLYDAMNKGIALAQGSWIYFLGADDLLYDETVFTKCMNFVKQAPSTKVLYGNVKVVGNNNLMKNGSYYDGIFNYKKLLEQNICQQAILYSKDVFKEYGVFNTKYRLLADFDFNLMVFNKVVFNYIDIPIAIYNAEGLSYKENDDKFWLDRGFNIISYNDNSTSFLKLHSSLLMDCSISMIKQNQISLSLKYLFKALTFPNNRIKYLYWYLAAVKKKLTGEF